jgi:phosphomannomutase
MIDASIFKAYDVRGIHPAQLDGEVARRVGRALVHYLGARRIAVGRDVRVSSPEIAAGFIAGARAEGCDVTDIGVASTDMLYYYVARHALDGGAVITASHNPREWNGIKMVRKDALALSGDAGIKEIREWVTAGRFADEVPAGAVAAARPVSVLDEYVQHCLSFIDPSVVPRLRVVLDPGNGMGALGASALFAHLPVETIRMYFDLDGTFPNHPPDPLEEANRREIMARVAAEKADLGIAWDGDADRCFFVDDTGAFVPGDFVTALLGEAFCRKVPGAKIVYDVRASRAVADRVTAAGGSAVMHRVGHAFIKKRMRDENAVFGGEVSGHFYFRENWYADNGMIPALLVLELLGREKRRLSEILAPLRERYHISGEINSKVSDVEAALARLEERYRGGRITRLDGLSVDYDDWHFNVRPSNTEPLLRLNLEATSAAAMQARRDEVLAVIRA